jgi:hypothetical protein
MDWSLWINVPGPAPEYLNFTTVEATHAVNLAHAYIALNGQSSPENYKDYFAYYSNLKVIFYDTLRASIGQMNIAMMERIDADYNTTADKDPEVKQRWLPTGIMLDYEPALPTAHTWISSMGRAKYLTPVYVALEDHGMHDTGV